MSFRVQQVDHVEVMVMDLEASARWYKDILGLKETHRWDPEPIFIEANGTALALFQAVHAAREPGKGVHWHRVAWRTDEGGFAAAQEHLKNKGITFRGPVDHGIAWSIYFTDPDGNPLEITYYR